MTKKWTDGELRFAVRRSKSINEVVGRLGYGRSGGRPRRVWNAITRLGLDTSHFLHPLYSGRRRWTAETIFQKDVDVANDVLKRFFKNAATIPYKCSECPVEQEWNGLPLVLQLEHRNGEHTDNRLQNLTWLCPNCHSQTSTYAGRANWRNGKKIEKDKGTDRRVYNKPPPPHARKIDHEAVVNRYADQKNLTTLASEFSVSDTAIRKILKRAGAYTPKRYQKVVPEDILARWDEVRNTTAVALEFGCDVRTLRRLLRQRKNSN